MKRNHRLGGDTVRPGNVILTLLWMFMLGVLQGVYIDLEGGW